MDQHGTALRASKLKAALALAAACALALVMVFGGAGTALAAHKAIKDYGTLGDNPATTLLINSAGPAAENFQFGTYEDPYGNLTISEGEFGNYLSRDCFIKNKTGYRVWLTLWGVAQSNYKSFKWWWSSSDQSGASVKSEGTTDVWLMTTILRPEQQIYVRAVATKKSSVRIVLKAVYSYCGEAEGIQIAPAVTATKMSSKKVEVKASIPNTYASKTKLELYMNGKKVKTVRGKSSLTYTVTDASAAKARFHAVATTIGDARDTEKSRTVEPQPNVRTFKVSKDIGTYGAGTLTFKPSKLSYSGGNLVIEGYTVNKSNVSLPGFCVWGYCNGKTFFELDKPDYILKPGIRKKTFKLKAKKVVNLVAGDISIHDMN